MEQDLNHRFDEQIGMCRCCGMSLLALDRAIVCTGSDEVTHLDFQRARRAFEAFVRESECKTKIGYALPA